MERSEPTLVPEWLRSAGSVTGGGSLAHHFASSSSHSDVPSLAHHSRSRNSRSISDFDSPRSSFLDRSSSSNLRRNSSNGSAKHPYSSFSRNNRDKDRERDKDRPSFGDHWDRDSSDPIGSILARVDNEKLRRSHSMVTRKQGEPLPRRVAADSKDSGNGNHNNGNGLLPVVNIGSSIQKAVFEKDFPSLGADERQGAPDVARVSSPGLSSAVQNLPVGSSALISGEGWTSALAVVPNVVGSGSTSSLSAPQTATNSGSGASSTMAGLNMAEALVQAPSQTRTAPQLSVKTQRLEELALKQSRQLIPVTPSMPKGSVLSSSDKSKSKPVVRTSEVSVAVKSGQQQSSLLHHLNQSPHGLHTKPDMSKTSHGKLLVLKPVRENGVLSPTQKDAASPTNHANSRAANNQSAVASAVASAPLKNINNAKLPTGERKAAALNLISGFPVEKRPSLAQTQSRNDFFNHLKKKTSNNSSAVLPDSGPQISAPGVEKSEATKEVISTSATSDAVENGSVMIPNGDSCQEAQGFPNDGKDMSSSAAVYPDEEEAAFLRSLGWEENAGEDEGLTEEEINAFYREYMKLRPSLKLSRGMQLPESHVTNLGGASSEFSSSDSGSEA